jgi:hypothetical protein
MYILYLFEAVCIAHDISLEKEGLECNCICLPAGILSVVPPACCYACYCIPASVSLCLLVSPLLFLLPAAQSLSACHLHAS